MRPHYLPKRPRFCDVLTYCWPMTHQALYPHSKPLSHYLDRHVERLEGEPPATLCLSFHSLLINDIHRTWSLFIGKILCIVWILQAWCMKRTSSILFIFAGAVVSIEVTPRQSTGMFRDWRHTIEDEWSNILSENWYVCAQKCFRGKVYVCTANSNLLVNAFLYKWGPWPTTRIRGKNNVNFMLKVIGSNLKVELHFWMNSCTFSLV